MSTSLKNRWVSVAFIVHCGETLAIVSSTYEAEPAWHRLAINQALACAKARATIGGPVEHDDEAIVLDGQYFDHYDVEALSSALGNCLNATLNTAAEVDQPEADLLNAATAIAGLAMDLAFEDHERDLVATTLSWMGKASDRHEVYAKSCLEVLVAAERLLELKPDEAVPEHVLNFLQASTLKQQ